MSFECCSMFMVLKFLALIPRPLGSRWEGFVFDAQRLEPATGCIIRSAWTTWSSLHCIQCTSRYLTFRKSSEFNWYWISAGLWGCEPGPSEPHGSTTCCRKEVGQSVSSQSKKMQLLAWVAAGPPNCELLTTFGLNTCVNIQILYIYIYIHMHISIYIYTCIHLCACLCVCVCFCFFGGGAGGGEGVAGSGPAHLNIVCLGSPAENLNLTRQIYTVA